MWDDHEIANNPWMNGAEDHQAWEGDFTTRARAAIRAYHEWLPTREPSATGDSSGNDDSGNADYYYNRTVHFGDVASFVVLETRLTGAHASERKPRRRRLGEPDEGNRRVRHEGAGVVAGKRVGAPHPRLKDRPGRVQERGERADGGSRPARVARGRGDEQRGVGGGVADRRAGFARDGHDEPGFGKGGERVDGDGATPPTGHGSWRAALEAWTDWTGTAPPARSPSATAGGRCPSIRRGLYPPPDGTG